MRVPGEGEGVGAVIDWLVAGEVGDAAVVDIGVMVGGNGPDAVVAGPGNDNSNQGTVTGKAVFEHLVEFRLEDALTADVSDATVVTLYLLSSSNAKLRPLLTRQLKPGARIVSHQFPIGSWPPPWGSYQTGWPYQFNPWTMSEAQFRNNPPPPLIP